MSERKGMQPRLRPPAQAYVLRSSQQVFPPGLRSFPYSSSEATEELSASCSVNGTIFHVSFFSSLDLRF